MKRSDRLIQFTESPAQRPFSGDAMADLVEYRLFLVELMRIIEEFGTHSDVIRHRGQDSRDLSGPSSRISHSS